MTTTHTRKPNAFTLIELLVVVSIIAILISILLPALGQARAQAKKVLCMSNMRQIGLGISLYVTEASDDKYPQQRSDFGLGNQGQLGGHWWAAIRPYVNSELEGPAEDAGKDTVGHCPTHTENGPIDPYSYRGSWWMMTDCLDAALNPKQEAIRASSVKNPSAKLIVFETHTSAHLPITGDWWSGGWLKAAAWVDESPVYPFDFQTHENVSNFLFCDTHVASAHGDTLKDPAAHWYHRGVNWRNP